MHTFRSAATILSICLGLGLSPLSLGHGANCSHSKLGDQMVDMKEAMKSAGSALKTDNFQKAKQYLVVLKHHSLKARDLTPIAAKDMKDPETFTLDYQTEMEKFIALIDKGLEAIKQEDRKKALEQLKDMNDFRRASHKTYNPHCD